MILPGFIGGINQVFSRNVNAEWTRNWLVEHAPGTPKVPAALYPFPAVKPFVALGDGPIRGAFGQGGRAFFVSATSLYEVFASQTATLRGTTTSDGKPATIWSNGTNGNQLFITSGGKGYVYDLLTNVVTEVTTNSEPVQMGAYSDGYFFALKAQSNSFTISALFDGTTWDPIDVYQVSTVSDPLKALVESHREIWTFGEQTTSVWQNVGDADTPFQPVPGVKILQGIGATFSAVSIDNTILWLGGNELGNRIVYRADGYTPKRISNHAIECALDNYPRVDDAEAFAMQFMGHSFYVLYLPSPPDTARNGIDHTHLVYDVKEDCWVDWALWNIPFLRWEPYVARNHCYQFDKHLVGDRRGPGVYHLSQQYLTDRLVELGAA
jgi:hypothetical protein